MLQCSHDKSSSRASIMRSEKDKEHGGVGSDGGGSRDVVVNDP